MFHKNINDFNDVINLTKEIRRMGYAVPVRPNKVAYLASPRLIFKRQFF